MFISSKKIIGLDIGSSSIKLAELTVTKDGAMLDNFAVIPAPAQAMANGEIIDSIVIAESIKAAFKENSFRFKKACVGLSGTAVIIKKISIPRVDPKNIREQVRYEAAQYLPFDISQVTLDHHILPFSQSAENMDLLVVAAQNEFILNYLQAISQAGLKCSILDVSSLALANIFELNYGKTSEPVALFNFGSNITNFLVLFQGEVIFSRDIPVGGFHFTNEISKNMGVTFEEAESLKISQSQNQEVPEETRTFMNIALEFVTEEIRNSIDFYTATANGLTISKAYFTGGASLTAGLIEHLNSALKLQFEVLNPYLKVKSGHKKLTPHYMQQIAPFVAVACGLGIRKGEK
ncbi:MAG: type IV pilus assembly protein PilM [Bdellovibrionaceae bacterium]|nr:type IV pilus assembly protein PilM [Bdellovibrio sp.]